MAYANSDFTNVSVTALNNLQNDPSAASWLAPLGYTATGKGFSVVSEVGQTAAIFATQSVQSSQAGSQGNIGAIFFTLNNNTSAKQTTYGWYSEARRFPLTGTTHAFESNIENFGDTANWTPASGLLEGITVAGWFSCGRYDAGAPVNDASAVAGIVKNGARFRRGLVFKSDSLDPFFGEAMSLPQDYGIGWYDPSNSPVPSGYLNGVSARFQVSSDSSYFFLQISRSRANGALVAAGDIGGAINFDVVNQPNGGLLGPAQVFSRYVGGNRLGLHVEGLNDDGAHVGISVLGQFNNAVTPTVDNELSLGNPSFRWGNLFLANSPVVTSDSRDKRWRGTLTPTEKNAIREIAKGVGVYQALDTGLGGQQGKALMHVGIKADDVVRAFQSEGLDAFAYGLVSEYPLMRGLEEVGSELVHATEEQSLEEEVLKIVDGKAIRSLESRRVSVPLYDMVPVVNVDGTPALEAARGGGRELGMVPRMHRIPRMVERPSKREVLKPVLGVDDKPRTRLGVRYEELSLAMLAVILQDGESPL